MAKKPPDPLTERLASLMQGNLAANAANPGALDRDKFERSKHAAPAPAPKDKKEKKKKD
jgi:hypothetical protein